VSVLMAVVLLAGGGLTASSADDTGLRDEREGEGGRGKGEGGRGKGEGRRHGGGLHTGHDNLKAAGSSVKTTRTLGDPDRHR